MSSFIIFDPLSDKIKRHRETLAGTKYVEDRTAEEFFVELSKRTLFDSGLLPQGTLSIKQAGNHLQIAIVAPPAKNLLIWGATEGSSSAETYLLAQPYRLMVGVFQDGNFLGARMFYSPVPITSMDNPLYHANVPNLNCQGYRETGVGWVCLYQSDDTTNLSIAEKAAYIGLRCSGNEAFNDDNMRETDGPRFYEQHGKPQFTWDPSAWEAKTEQDGIDWTLDENLWIPIRVYSAESQAAHVEYGEILTVGAVLNGCAAYSYNDMETRLVLDHQDISLTNAKFYQQVIDKAFTSATPIGAPQEVESAQPSAPFDIGHGQSFDIEEQSFQHDEDTFLGSISLSDIAEAMANVDSTKVLAIQVANSHGVAYTIKCSLEIGSTASKKAILATVYSQGQIVAQYVVNNKDQFGETDGTPSTWAVLLGEYSKMVELYALTNGPVWTSRPELPQSHVDILPVKIPFKVVQNTQNISNIQSTIDQLQNSDEDLSCLICDTNLSDEDDPVDYISTSYVLERPDELVDASYWPSAHVCISCIADNGYETCYHCNALIIDADYEIHDDIFFWCKRCKTD